MNADVITSGIREVTADGVVEANDGTLHRVDAIVWALRAEPPLTDRVLRPARRGGRGAWGAKPKRLHGARPSAASPTCT